MLIFVQDEAWKKFLNWYLWFLLSLLVAVNINGSYVNDLGIFWRLHIASKKMVKGWDAIYLSF